MSADRCAVEPEALWQLFIRDHCGLCDQALAQLAACAFPAFEMVWIDHDPALEAIYGQRVPVLQHRHSKLSLDWPFETQRLQALVE